MKLREELHQVIDELDECALASLYAHVQSLRPRKPPVPLPPAPSLDEVLEMTASDPGSWSDDVIANRDDRF